MTLRDDICLTGPRVLLRPIREDDAEAMFAYARDPEVTRFLPWEPAPALESVRPFLAEQTARRRAGEALSLAIVLRESKQMIGSTDLMDLAGPRPAQAELGYLLAQPYWGRGLMTEAAGLTATFAFAALRLARLIAFADSQNIGSRRVLEKIGMRAHGSEMRVVKNENRLYIRYEMGQVQA
jgi:ribosomal-protein-alanine N-acetyltransferase